MIEDSGISDNDVMGSMIAHMDFNGILTEWVEMYPRLVKTIKEMKNDNRTTQRDS